MVEVDHDTREIGEQEREKLIEEAKGRTVDGDSDSDGGADYAEVEP